MAFRGASYWRSMLSRLGPSRGVSTAPPRMKPSAATMDASLQKPMLVIKGEFVPMYVALGLIMVSVSLGLYTAEHQLVYAPNVFVSKKKRETLPEVVEPDYVVDEAEKFKTKSLFRKVAHIQNIKEITVLPDPIRVAPFQSPKHAETLKSVGVDPKEV